MDEPRLDPVSQVNAPPAGTWPPPKAVLPGGTRERRFALPLLILSLCIGNTGQYLGLGFALPFVLMGLLTLWYVWDRPRVTAYGLCCLLLSMVLAAASARTADNLTLILVFPLILFGYFLGLVAMTRANARPLGAFSSVLDVCYAVFDRTFSQVVPAFRGLLGRKTQGKKGSGAIWGVLIAIPVLFILVPLLTSADAAFEGLLSRVTVKLPQNSELVISLILGLGIFLLAYAQAVSLRACPGRTPAQPRPGRAAPAAVTGFLGVISLVYLLYLLSQGAYFFSAFRGILPQGFTSADYARRGFFEMAWIVALNLLIVGCVEALCRRTPTGTLPKVPRLLSLFVCLFSLVLIATAFSKMALYMGSFGLTRLRVLTSLFMLWLTLWVLAAAVRLFRPRFPHMKIAVLAALILACLACWGDLDGIVARYNVRAYETGKLQTVDLDTLQYLSDSAIPYIGELTEDKDPAVADRAGDILLDWAYGHAMVGTDDADGDLVFESMDLRSWNLATAQARATVLDYLTSRGYRVFAPELAKRR